MTRHAERRSASFRRMLFSVSLFVLPLALGLFVITSYLMPLSECASEVVADVPSPNGSHRAFVFRLNCGATTGYTSLWFARTSRFPIDPGTSSSSAESIRSR